MTEEEKLAFIELYSELICKFRNKIYFIDREFYTKSIKLFLNRSTGTIYINILQYPSAPRYLYWFELSNDPQTKGGTMFIDFKSNKIISDSFCTLLYKNNISIPTFDKHKPGKLRFDTQLIHRRCTILNIIDKDE